jgi:hypothetical protein
VVIQNYRENLHKKMTIHQLVLFAQVADESTVFSYNFTEDRHILCKEVITDFVFCHLLALLQLFMESNSCGSKGRSSNLSKRRWSASQPAQYNDRGDVCK